MFYFNILFEETLLHDLSVIRKSLEEIKIVLKDELMVEITLLDLKHRMNHMTPTEDVKILIL